jgi:signal transduction histidine kinase
VTTSHAVVLDHGFVSFTVESRILRELGERLVKQPEVALIELIKNAYDADATTCTVTYEPPERILVADDGQGMTFSEFTNGWMRIGTSLREDNDTSRLFHRAITGEKGIGRFATRFLGTLLILESVAHDSSRNLRTKLSATFDWPAFDKTADLGQLKVPYNLTVASSNETLGTSLEIRRLRSTSNSPDRLAAVRTSVASILSPHSALLTQRDLRLAKRPAKATSDPGFALKLLPLEEDAETGNVAAAILANAALRAHLQLDGDRLRLQVFRRGAKAPSLSIDDKYPTSTGSVYADIRYFPQRKGAFAGLPIDGRRAKSWLKDNSGVAIFDRGFRVLPYGTQGDDWLSLAADTAKRSREPRSSIAKQHFPMDDATRLSTQLNYMLRLPYSQQLVGVVEVKGRRSLEQGHEVSGLISAADREGFIENAAFAELRDLVRGAVEAIAAEDRILQQEQERAEQEASIERLRQDVKAAIQDIEANPNIRLADKKKIVAQLVETQERAQEYEERTQQREAALEIMSLLGVVAGFMTHEFGVAFSELQTVHSTLEALGHRDKAFLTVAEDLEIHLKNLREFVTYSQGFVRGAGTRPAAAYPARPRIQQVLRVFGQYATTRGITVEVLIEPTTVAPLVPASMYGGIALNLFTNALKAVTASPAKASRRIAFRAWNERGNHRLEVSDTGVGIPVILRERVFEPLFTTTGSNNDPLGSGMGLGLSLVRRAVEAYGGRVKVIEPPPGFSTCLHVELPLSKGHSA